MTLPEPASSLGWRSPLAVEQRRSSRPPPSDAALREPPVILKRGTNLWVARAGASIVLFWRREPTVPAIERLGQLIEQLDGAERAVLSIVGPHAQAPSREARRALAKLMANGHVRASAVVYGEEGFRGAAVRSIATGISLLAQQPYRHRVFAAPVEAARWLEREIGSVESGVRADRIRHAADMLAHQAQLASR